MNESNGNGTITLQIPTRTTDPATLRLMAEQLRQTVEESPVEQFVSSLDVSLDQSPPKPKLPRVVVQKRIFARVKDWVAHQIASPGRIVRWLTWWWKLPFHAASFAWVVTGPANDEDTAQAWDDECEKCEHLYKFVRLNGDVGSHCAKCDCPATKRSENAYRNRKKRWTCPQQKHKRPYRTDLAKEAIEGLGYDESVAKLIVINSGGGGCTGCGCGKATRQGG